MRWNWCSLKWNGRFTHSTSIISYALCIIITITGLWDEHHHHHLCSILITTTIRLWIMYHHHYQIMGWASTSFVLHLCYWPVSHFCKENILLNDNVFHLKRLITVWCSILTLLFTANSIRNLFFKYPAPLFKKKKKKTFYFWREMVFSVSVACE